ncbi:MAG: S9 family peptidase [Candidatus Aminicenantes bacterium]|jgi:dipeptidyl aminopeptidase/acylaminoacyl peptidase
MRTKRFYLWVYFIAFGMAPFFSFAQRAMTVDDLLNTVRLKNVLISPDGEKVFYATEKLNWSKNNYVRSYIMCDADGKNAKVFLREGLDGSQFRFSPDSQFLSFLSIHDKKEQIFLIPVNGGEAHRLTSHCVSVKEYQWIQDGSGLVFLADEARNPEEQKEYTLGADAVYVDEAPNGKENARFSRLWFFDLKAKSESIICKENLVIEDFDVSRDGKQIVFVGRPDTRTNYPFHAELYMIMKNGTDFHQLTHNEGPEEEPRWSPDGTSIIFHAPYKSVEDGKYDLRCGYFWIFNTQSSKFRRLESQDRGEMYRGAKEWSPDGKYFYFNELHGTNTNLFRINITTDTIEAMTDIEGTLQPKSFSSNMNKMAYTFQDHRTPPDVYVADLRLDNPVRITEANPWIQEEILLSTAKLIQWESEKDGMEIEGLFFLPLGYKKGERVPMIVHIHGGPAGVVENSFRPEFHVFVGLGYAVLGPNYRGSTGYGDKVLRGLIGAVGDGEHADIMSGVDFVVDNYGIDPDRMAVRGWSWGGVSTGYLITQVHRFKAASVGAGVFNWAAETGPGFNFDVSLWYIGGSPWENPEEWAKRSAITYVKNVRTPTILFHGGKDTTSSVNQSLMYFTALRDIGKIPVRYIKFPRQGHGIEEPRHRRIHLIEEIRWFKKYIEGIEWKPLERKE